MSKLLDFSLSSNKEYLLNDLTYCLTYVDDLKTKGEILQKSSSAKGNTNVPEDVCKWLTKREALEEKIQKILINAKEEWRSFLPILPKLMSVCLDILQISRPHEQIFDMTLNFLRSLSLCINPKRLRRYWPTEVLWLLKVTEWLEKYLQQYLASKDFASTNVLILWLASAIKTPFDLSRFDGNQVGADHQPSIASRIENIIEKNIDNYSLFPVIHLLAGSFYSRPDCYCRLSKFIKKLLSKVSSSSLSLINSKLCSLRIVATLLKSVDRSVMLEHVDQIVTTLPNAIDQDHEQCVKLCMKICGRLALVHLKPSEQFKWRYRCGKRFTKLIDSSSITSNDNFDQQRFDNENENINFDLDLPDYFENLIQILLKNLVHKYTVVRFSVSKYLASIGSRLPYQYSDEILEYVFDLCQPLEDDYYWHGSCLALAEFVRRGYVQIDSMSKVIKVLDQALFFEQIKGSFSSGAHVRDAACYICWSMARAYDGQLIAKFVTHLAPMLLNVACFDREVNCRRAASAVIQELTGRTQQFPHWTDVIPRTEFHELSQIEHTYEVIGVHFAIVYPEFRPIIIENLLFQKCIHWDPSIRRLASKTIGKISNKCSFFGQPYFENFLKTLENLNQLDLNHRHGSIITISYLLNEDKSLKQQTNLTNKVFDIFVEQFLSLHSTFSSFGTNLIRESLLIFVEKCVPLLLDTNASALEKISAFLLDSIRSNESNELIQSRTIHALLRFMDHIDNDFADQFLSNLISLILNCDHFIVSTLAQFLCQYMRRLENTVEKILLTFVEFLDKWFDQELRRPETIAEVARVLLVLSAHYYIHLSNTNRQLLTKIHANIINCLDDHSITKKGDTGLSVRRACIEACYLYVCQVDSEQLMDIIQLIAAEAASHRNKTFLLSMVQLTKISALILKDSKHKDLQNLKLARISTLDPSSMEDIDLYQECIRMFECPQLISNLWSGFVCVLADPILEKHSRLITDYIKNIPNRNEILVHFLYVATTKARCQRLSIPCLISGYLLLTQMSTTSEFRENLAKFAWMACERTSNPRKYILACDIFCALLLLEKISLVFGYLYVLLGHRLPRVRLYTSVQIYTSILSLDIDGRHEKLDEIGQLLQETDWSNLSEAKRERDRLRTLIKNLYSN